MSLRDQLNGYDKLRYRRRTVPRDAITTVQFLATASQLFMKNLI